MAPYHPADRCFAYPAPEQLVEQIVPLLVGDGRTRTQDLLQQLHPVLIELALLAGRFARAQRLSFFGQLYLTFD